MRNQYTPFQLRWSGGIKICSNLVVRNEIISFYVISIRLPMPVTNSSWNRPLVEFKPTVIILTPGGISCMGARGYIWGPRYKQNTMLAHTSRATVTIPSYDPLQCPQHAVITDAQCTNSITNHTVTWFLLTHQGLDNMAAILQMTFIPIYLFVPKG